MKLIVGLGNPGNKYKITRHNAGFLVVDKLRQKIGLSKFSKSFFNKALLTKGQFRGSQIMLMKPLAYMNNSGPSVKKIVAKYKVNYQDLLVVYDDLDIMLGYLRFRPKGSSAGHKGLQSVIEALGAQEFNRLRIGIDSQQRGKQDTVDYVLSKFDQQQLETIKPVIARAVDCCCDWLAGKDDENLRKKYSN